MNLSKARHNKEWHRGKTTITEILKKMQKSHQNPFPASDEAGFLISRRKIDKGSVFISI